MDTTEAVAALQANERDVILVRIAGSIHLSHIGQVPVGLNEDDAAAIMQAAIDQAITQSKQG